MIKGFRDFIMRGNVIDLAVAVVIGTAFNNVISSISDKLIMPFVAALGGDDVGTLTTQLRAGNNATIIDWAAIITAFINFLIVAAVVYFVFVLPMNKYRERQAARGEEPIDEIAEDIQLLREIRDELRARN
jgi:large conductance mechanosensitive channel